MSRAEHDIDRVLAETLAQERMPEDLAQSTLAFIHRKAASQAVSPADAVRTAPSPARASVSNAGAQAAISPAAAMAQAPQSNPSGAVDQDDGVVAFRPYKKRRMSRRRFVQLMAACLAIGSLGAGAVALAGETTKVALGGDNSIELGINRWGTVTRADASSAELAAQLDSLDLVGLDYASALCALSEDYDLQAMLLENELLVIDVTGTDATQRSDVLAYCQASSETFSCKTMCMASESGIQQEAQAHDMSVSHYAMYLKISEIDPTITVETCRAMSMRQLRTLLAQTQQNAGLPVDDEEALQDAGGKHGAGGGHGMGGGMGRGKGAGMGMGHGNGGHAAEGEDGAA